MSDTESKNIPAPRREWSVTSLAIEVFSIVLGVLLALGLSEWSEERQHRQQADIALGNVLHEIRGNQTTLDSIHANNSATLAAMSAADPDDAKRRDSGR